MKNKEIICESCHAVFVIVVKGKGTGYRRYCDKCKINRSKQDKEYMKEYYKKSDKEKNRKQSKISFEKRIANGLCGSCNEKRISYSNSWCEKHWYISIAANSLYCQSVKLGDLLKKKMEKQNYRCPYTNELLVPALNCHLDHILPKSRFPELIRNIDNVEWVLDKVNMAKRNMTKEEFILFCKTIANNT
jgi:hypothetical protein